MKCIQSIKQMKTVDLGVIKRVNDNDAEASVKSSYWKYVSKSEWKKQNKPQVTEKEEVTKTEKKNTKKGKK